jgi:hypothetical protein
VVSARPLLETRNLALIGGTRGVGPTSSTERFFERGERTFKSYRSELAVPLLNFVKFGSDQPLRHFEVGCGWGGQVCVRGDLRDEKVSAFFGAPGRGQVVTLLDFVFPLDQPLGPPSFFTFTCREDGVAGARDVLGKACASTPSLAMMLDFLKGDRATQGTWGARSGRAAPTSGARSGVVLTIQRVFESVVSRRIEEAKAGGMAAPFTHDAAMSRWRSAATPPCHAFDGEIAEGPLTKQALKTLRESGVKREWWDLSVFRWLIRELDEAELAGDALVATDIVRMRKKWA